MTYYNSLKCYVQVGALCLLTIFTACKREAAPSQTNNIAARAHLETEAMAATTTTCGSPASNHLISLAYAYQLVDNYRIASRVQGRVCQLYDLGGWVLAETFPASVIQSLLSQPGICSFRIYNGLDTDNRQHLVLVGVDQNGLDALSRNAPAAVGGRGNGDEVNAVGTTTTTEIIAEMGLPCPRICAGVYTGS